MSNLGNLTVNGVLQRRFADCASRIRAYAESRYGAHVVPLLTDEFLSENPFLVAAVFTGSPLDPEFRVALDRSDLAHIPPPKPQPKPETPPAEPEKTKPEVPAQLTALLSLRPSERITQARKLGISQ